MKSLLTVSSVLLFALPSLAQDGPPQPPRELARFKPMLGHFEGAGTWTPVPGAEAVPWTCVTSAELTVDGFAIQEWMKVTFDQEGFGAFEAITLHGWDGERRRYLSMSVSSMGTGGTGEAFWVDAATLVQTQTTVEEGQPVIERSTSSFDEEGGFTLTMERGVGTGEFYAYVEGEFRRVETPASERVIEASTGWYAPTGEHTRALRGMIGTWKVTGQMVPAPGVDPVPISGVETIRPILGGAALQAVVVGDADPSGFVYRAVNYLAWDERGGCYRSVHADNMGMVGQQHMYQVGQDFVVTNATTMFGSPVVDSTVIHMKDGGIAGVTARQISGTGEPVTTFEARYEKETD